MQKTRLHRLSYIGVLVSYCILASLVTFFIYQDQKTLQDKWINASLAKGTGAMSVVLPQDLHSNAMDGKPLSLEEEKQLAFTLGKLAKSLSLEYLYTLIQKPDQSSFFVISSPTDKEMAGADYERAYLTPYKEMSEELVPFYSTDSNQYLEYEDRWGEFRTIYQRVETPDGRSYLLAADIDITKVRHALRNTLFRTIAGFSFLVIVCIPLLVFIQYLRARELRAAIRQTYIDTLTQLGNRSALTRDLHQASQAQLLLINILRFNDINGAHGPAFGDLVLTNFAKHLADFSHSNLNPVHCYRLHGDQFALLVDQEHITETNPEILRDLLGYIASFRYKVDEDNFIRLQVAGGAALNQPSDHITLAQIALNAAENSSQSIIIFDKKLAETTHFHDNLEQLAILKSALDNDYIVPWYQPIFTTDTLELSRYEALTRIVDDKGEIVSMPRSFLPVAHRYQLYWRLSYRILLKTLEWMKNNPGKVSINLSICDVENQTNSTKLLKAIRASGMGKRLSFELLENEAIHDIDKVRRFAYKLKRLGCRLGIDDLGKEYSNFDRILALPIDFIKLDGYIIHHIEKHEESFEIIENIVALAHRNNISVTAERVSTKNQLNIARRLKCDLVQGFYLGEPAPQAISEHHCQGK